MRILGLDPGLARTGFGILDTGNPQSFVRCGCITTPPNRTVSDRLAILGNDLNQLITATNPDIAAVEEIYFGTNTKTAIMTAQAWGVTLFILRQHNIQVKTVTPLQVKSRLCGFGRATKQQVQAVVTARLKLSKPPQPDDAADGLAIALCLAET